MRKNRDSAAFFGAPGLKNCLFSARRRTPVARPTKNKNLKNSEVANFSLDIGGYKVYNADYNNVTMR